MRFLPREDRKPLTTSLTDLTDYHTDKIYANYLTSDTLNWEHHTWMSFSRLVKYIGPKLIRRCAEFD